MVVHIVDLTAVPVEPLYSFCLLCMREFDASAFRAHVCCPTEILYTVKVEDDGNQEDGMPQSESDISDSETIVAFPCGTSKDSPNMTFARFDTNLNEQVGKVEITFSDIGSDTDSISGSSEQDFSNIENERGEDIFANSNQIPESTQSPQKNKDTCEISGFNNSRGGKSIPEIPKIKINRDNISLRTHNDIEENVTAVQQTDKCVTDGLTDKTSDGEVIQITKKLDITCSSSSVNEENTALKALGVVVEMSTHDQQHRKRKRKRRCHSKGKSKKSKTNREHEDASNSTLYCEFCGFNASNAGNLLVHKKSLYTNHFSFTKCDINKVEYRDKFKENCDITNIKEQITDVIIKKDKLKDQEATSGDQENNNCDLSFQKNPSSETEKALFSCSKCGTNFNSMTDQVTHNEIKHGVDVTNDDAEHLQKKINANNEFELVESMENPAKSCFDEKSDNTENKSEHKSAAFKNKIEKRRSFVAMPSECKSQKTNIRKNRDNHGERGVKIHAVKLKDCDIFSFNNSANQKPEEKEIVPLLEHNNVPTLVDSKRNPKKTITLEQYKQRRLSTSRSSTESTSSVSNTKENEVATHEVTRKPTDISTAKIISDLRSTSISKTRHNAISSEPALSKEVSDNTKISNDFSELSRKQVSENHSNAIDSIPVALLATSTREECFAESGDIALGTTAITSKTTSVCRSISKSYYSIGSASGNVSISRSNEKQITSAELSKEVEIPVGVTMGYSPAQMAIIDAASTAISLSFSLNGKNLDDAEFSDDPEIDETVELGDSQEYEPSIFCEACGLECETMEILKSHMKHVHRGFAFKCFVCDVTCGNLDSLIKHQFKHDGSAIRSAESQFLMQRKSTPNQYFPYYCNLCGQGFALIRLFIYHKADYHFPKVVTAVHGFEKVNDLGTSDEFHKDEQRISSQFDVTTEKVREDETNKVSDGHQEINTIIPEPLRSLKPFLEYCEICGRLFTNSIEKQQHFHLQNFVCVICRISFELLDQLVIHYDLSHIKDEVLNCEKTELLIEKRCKFCKFCGLGFYFIDELLSHREKIHNELLHKEYSSGINSIVNENDYNSNKHLETAQSKTSGCDEEATNNCVKEQTTGSAEKQSFEDIFKKPSIIPGLDAEDVSTSKHTTTISPGSSFGNGRNAATTFNQRSSKVSELDQASEDNSALNTSHKCSKKNTDLNNEPEVANRFIIDICDSSQESDEDITNYFEKIDDDFGKKHEEAEVSKAAQNTDIFTAAEELASFLDEGDLLDETVDVVAPNRLSESLTKAQYEPKGLFCEVCGHIFDTLNLLDQHHTNNHFEKPFSCSICGIRYQDIVSLLHHHENHSADILAYAERSSFKSLLSLTVPEHFRYYCILCGKGYNYITELKFHRASVCPRKEEFKIFGKFWDDLKAVKASCAQSIKCYKCNECFKSFHELRKHISRTCASEVSPEKAPAVRNVSSDINNENTKQPEKSKKAKGCEPIQVSNSSTEIGTRTIINEQIADKTKSEADSKTRDANLNTICELANYVPKSGTKSSATINHISDKTSVIKKLKPKCDITDMIFQRASVYPRKEEFKMDALNVVKASGGKDGFAQRIKCYNCKECFKKFDELKKHIIGRACVSEVSSEKVPAVRNVSHEKNNEKTKELKKSVSRNVPHCHICNKSFKRWHALNEHRVKGCEAIQVRNSSTEFETRKTFSKADLTVSTAIIKTIINEQITGTTRSEANLKTRGANLNTISELANHKPKACTVSSVTTNQIHVKTSVMEKSKRKPNTIRTDQKPTKTAVLEQHNKPKPDAVPSVTNKQQPKSTASSVRIDEIPVRTSELKKCESKPDVVSSVTNNNYAVSSTTINLIPPKKGWVCFVCFNRAFDSKESYEMHEKESQKHKRRLELQKLRTIINTSEIGKKDDVVGREIAFSQRCRSGTPSIEERRGWSAERFSSCGGDSLRPTEKSRQLGSNRSRIRREKRKRRDNILATMNKKAKTSSNNEGNKDGNNSYSKQQDFDNLEGIYSLEEVQNLCPTEVSIHDDEKIKSFSQK